MPKLIEELKKEHTVIVETLNRIKKLGISSAEGKNTLLAAKNILLAHLKKEDEQLYPFLNKVAKNNDNLARILEIFAKDIDIISKTALDFFDKYSTSYSGIEFAKSFGNLFATLSQRISKEEKIIYKKYDELKR